MILFLFVSAVFFGDSDSERVPSNVEDIALTVVDSLLPENHGSIYCDEKDFKEVTLKYHVSSDLKSWYQALINCRSAGMELASISSERDQENLEKFLKQYGHDKGYWLSGTNLGNGDYQWVSTGKPVVYTKWLANQPDDAKLAENKYRGENCIQWGIYHSSPYPSGWNDLYCGYLLRYICQEIEYCKAM